MNKILTLSEDQLNKASRKITGSLFVAQSVVNMAVINAFVVTPIVAASLAGTDSLAGLPATFTSIGRAAMAYPTGLLLDKIGRRRGLSISYLLGITGAMLSFGAIIAGNFYGFLAGAFLIGAMRSGSEQGRFIAAEVVPDSMRARMIGIIVFAGTISSIIGPRFTSPAANLAIRFSLPEDTGPYALAAIFIGIALIIVTIFLRPDPLKISRLIAATEDTSLEAESQRSVRPMRQIFGGRMIRVAVLSMVLGQLVMVSLMVITPLYMKRHNHALDSIAWVITAHTLGMFGLSVVTGQLIDRFRQLPIVAVGAIILLISAVIVPISPDFFPLAAALFLLGLGWNFCFVGGSSLLSENLLAHERGRAQGVNELMVAAGAASGAFIAGILFNLGNILVVSAFGFILALILLLITVWVLLRR